MKNEFMNSTKKAVVHLRNLQRRHTKIKDRADARLLIAQNRHAFDLARAEKVELQGWQQLMEIPGMTHATAAAVLDVSESTVSRWIGRLPKSAPISQQTRSPRGGTA
jgi:hypothetical protein